MELQNICLRLVLAVCLVPLVAGQGRMLDPPGRSSMWRVGYNTPVNLNDNVLSCGGIKHRWEINKGKCGVCGDPWDSKPRQNEAGGKYATNVITRVYTRGSVMEVTIDIAVANGGYFEFRLCPNNNFARPVTEKCLDNGLLSIFNGSTKFEGLTEGINTIEVKLPDQLECEQCVLQWRYRTADHMGCEVDEVTKEQTCEFGRGPIQTEFYACADIAIFKDAQTVKQKLPDFQELHTFSLTLENTEVSNSSAPVRKKRFVHPFGVGPIYSTNNQIPYFSMHRDGQRPHEPSFVPAMQTNRVHVGWLEPHGVKLTTRQRRRAHGARRPVRRRVFPSQMGRFSSNPQNGRNLLNVRQGEFFPGNVPVPSMIQVQRPMVRQIFANEEGAAVSLSSPLIRRTETTHVRNMFSDRFNSALPPKQVIHTVRHQTKSAPPIPVKQCNACPFDKCLDTPFELDGLFPGLFQDPLKFLECAKYKKLFNLKKYKLVSDGLPDCTHPRFKRQLVPTMPFVDDDDAGCCATRGQVIMPLTVESENDTYNVVQLPNDRNQFLVQGLCNQNRTVSCTSCEAEHNFQWVLVYDPKTDSYPPVSFVPVKFRHYCRCVNRGRRIFTG